jgi:hypothetical protein
MVTLDDAEHEKFKLASIRFKITGDPVPVPIPGPAPKDIPLFDKMFSSAEWIIGAKVEVIVAYSDPELQYFFGNKPILPWNIALLTPGILPTTQAA